MQGTHSRTFPTGLWFNDTKLSERLLSRATSVQKKPPEVGQSPPSAPLSNIRGNG